MHNPPRPGREGPELRRWLERIESLHSAPVDLGLERLRPVAERLGLLPAPLPVITVAGTNGKGSVAAMLEEVLRQAGREPGLYTSPHFFRFNERLRLDGTPAEDDRIVAALAAVDAARGSTPLTYFEMATLAAMRLFASYCRVAVLEVGLGGRLDAVNLWEPTVAAVTSVGVDHAAFLGDDREAVGREKAGVFRPGVPAVCGDPEPPDSLLVRETEGVSLWLYGRDFRDRAADSGAWYWQGPDGELGPLPPPAMAGSHQRRNAATAVAVGRRLPAGLGPRDEHWRRALPEVTVPGRCQVLPAQGGRPAVWLDVAHNPQAAVELASALAAEPPAGRNLAVFGGRADKDLAAVAGAVAPYVARWYPCRIDDANGLAGPDLEAVVRQTGGCARDGSNPPAVASGPGDAWRAACREAGPGDRIVAFGSFRVVEAVWAAAEGTSS